jgi:hypothetical protein
VSFRPLTRPKKEVAKALRHLWAMQSDILRAENPGHRLSM